MAGRRWIVAVTLLAILCLALPATTMALAATPTNRMGDSIEVESWTFQVVSFERRSDPLPGAGQAMTADPQDVLGVIVLDAFNEVGHARPLDLRTISLTDAEGHAAPVVETHPPADFLDQYEFEPGSTIVGPGEHARIALFFSIFPSWNLVTLHLGDGSRASVRIDECHCALPLPWLADR